MQQPTHHIRIPQLIRPEQLQQIDALLAKAKFVDGKLTATRTAKTVKNNLQIGQEDQELLGQLQGMVGQALFSHPVFQSAVLPKSVYTPLFSKYQKGMNYGWHVDSPVMGQPPVRTDVGMTIFLSDPNDYEGGELVIQSQVGEIKYKLAKGDAILYPTTQLHQVAEITSGERIACITWIQSMVRDAAHREILLALDQAHKSLTQRDSDAQEAGLILQSYSNLLREWAEV